MRPVLLTDRVALLCGDSKTLDLGEGSVDAVITDPPYLLDFMSKEWDSSGGRDVPINELTFRAWFAGLVAGEAFFRIHKERGGAYYACHFGIHMRADEGPMLRALAKRTGAGSIRESAAVENNQGVRSAPSLIWEVQSREDCWKIAQILDGAPLYGKKQREFDLWRRALESWTNAKRGNRWHGSENPGVMEPFYNAMKDLRPFDEELAASSFDPFGCPQYLFHYEWARAVYRALKPGGHLLAFGGTRTYHRMACAIEDAGFEIRDSLHWVYGSGFPKSLNVSKAIDASLGAERPVVGANPNHRAESGVAYEGVYAGGNTGAAEITGPGSPEGAQWDGWGTALKPAHEPIILARKPLDGTVAANVLAHGTGGINVDACRIGTETRVNPPAGNKPGGNSLMMSVVGMPADAEAREATGRWPANFLLAHAEGCELVGTREASRNVLKFSDEGYDRDGTVLDAGLRQDRRVTTTTEAADEYRCAPGCPVGDLGDPARYFYCAKPSTRERDYGCEGLPVKSGGEATDREDGSAGLDSPRAGAGRKGGRRNVHPTVKPIELMRWLCRLVTPPGGTVLDPFLGSGTTGIAALREGFSFVGVEREDEYIEIAKARIARALGEK